MHLGKPGCDMAACGRVLLGVKQHLGDANKKGHEES